MISVSVSDREIQAEMADLMQSLVHASAETALELRRVARANVPVKTGELRDSIVISKAPIRRGRARFSKVYRRKGGGGYAAVRRIGSRAQDDAGAVRIALSIPAGEPVYVTAAKFTAKWVEYKRRPFMRPATAAVANRIVGEKVPR